MHVRVFLFPRPSPSLKFNSVDISCVYILRSWWGRTGPLAPAKRRDGGKKSIHVYVVYIPVHRMCVCVERICTKIKLSRRERRKGKRERGNVHLISSEWALWTATAQEAQEHSETLYIYIYIYILVGFGPSWCSKRPNNLRALLSASLFSLVSSSFFLPSSSSYSYTTIISLLASLDVVSLFWSNLGMLRFLLPHTRAISALRACALANFPCLLYWYAAVIIAAV